jgi:hypothetical protein
MSDKITFASNKASYFEKEYRTIIKIDNKQITDLFNLVGAMNINDVKQFILIEHIPYNVVDNNNNTLIHRVLLENDLLKTEHQRLQMIKFLYNENANPDAPNNTNITPLHLACNKQYISIIEYLIDIGVDVNYQDNFGNTPLHRLFSGNIKPEEKTTIGNLIPVPKKIDTINNIKWKEERIKIWNIINTSPFIEAINNTLKYSIGSEEEEINVVKDFQEQLLQLNLDPNKKDDIKLLKDLQAASIHKFKGIIEKKWGKFSSISDIIIHPKEPNSFPLNDPSKLSIIKNSNTEKHITEMLVKSISDIKRLLEGVREPEQIDINDINEDLLTNYLTNNEDDLTLVNIENGVHPNYDSFNAPFIIGNDFADNIMDSIKNTFIGGARVCNIIASITPLQYDILFKKDKAFIVPILVYTIFTDFNNANNFNGNYNLDVSGGDVDKNTFRNLLAELFVNIINDTFISTDNFRQIITLINNNATFHLHRSLIPLLLDYNRTEDKTSWIYCIINNYLCNERFRSAAIDRKESNLIFEINLSVIYLIAGIINNKRNEDNLVLSISQCMRKSLYSAIFDDTIPRHGFLDNIADNIKPGSVLCALIYLLFSTNYIDLYDRISIVGVVDLFNHIDNIADNPNLNFIMKYSYNVMNNIDININILAVPLEMKELLKFDNNRENLCNMISYYYNNMEQPPQNQMVADLIDLIRKKRDDDDDVPELNIITKLRNFIIQPIADIGTLPRDNTMITVIDPDINNAIINMRNSKLFKILVNDNDAINVWSITEYLLPSRISCFISRTIDNLNGSELNNRMYIMKFIESYYLGMNFLGHTRPYNIYDNIEIPQRRGPPNILDTNYNLYNFDNSFDATSLQPDDNINNPSFQTLNEPEYNRPTNIINYAWVLNNLHIRITQLIQIFTSRLNFMFNSMLQINSSSTYATIISYTYPLLLVLSNYAKIIKNLTNDIKNPRYKEGFDSVQTINNSNIIQILDAFQEFRIGNFETNINQINGYIYLLYYLNANTDKMKLPKFIYHALGNDKPLIIFDANERLKLINPDSNYVGTNEVNTDILDNRKGHINRDIGLFSNVINNIGYINKETLRESFIISKNKKLPPSLRTVLNEFYRFNIIEVIKNNNFIINNELIIGEMNATNKNIQLMYLKAKIIEEVIQLYLKNKINEYGRDIYDKLIRGRVTQSSNTQLLFEKLDFSMELNKLPSEDFIKNISVNTQSGLKLYYSFVEPKQIQKQFYIYPDNYFGTNLLKNKSIVNIDLKIIKLMLENKANILTHNSEKISPLVMMIKNNYYKAFPIIKDNFDMSMYDNNNFYSPQYYLMENYKTHLTNYDKLIESCYNEMVTIIQSNENYNNNILKYMDVSFNVAKYITEQYLTENIIRFSNDFNSTNMSEIMELCGFNSGFINDIGKCKYNENLGINIIIPNLDEGITILNIIDKLNNNIDKTTINLNKYRKEKEELEKIGLNTNNVNIKIADTNINITNYRDQINKLNTLYYHNQNSYILNELKIINRYDELLNNMGNTYICYMDGWKQFLNKINYINNNIERLPTLCVNYQKAAMIDINDDFKTDLSILHKFYKHNYKIIKTYFENPRYIKGSPNNKVLGFVYDLLVHLTKSFICSNIESIIKKILYEYIISSQNIKIDTVLEQIDLMVADIKHVLYNIIPQKFVRNSVNIYNDLDDEASNLVETVAEILNNLIDLLKTSSYIDINDYTINILKNNIVQYFDTITYKLINNWNVVIENIFLFHINHYRIIECMKNII